MEETTICTSSRLCCLSCGLANTVVLSNMYAASDRFRLIDLGRDLYFVYYLVGFGILFFVLFYTFLPHITLFLWLHFEDEKPRAVLTALFGALMAFLNMAIYHHFLDRFLVAGVVISMINSPQSNIDCDWIVSTMANYLGISSTSIILASITGFFCLFIYLSSSRQVRPFGTCEL